MSVFNPRTFSTDWEVMVIDRLNRFVDTDKCAAFAGALRAELDLPIHIDWNTIEFGLGINSSFRQFRERIIMATDRAAQILSEFDLDLFPAAAHPSEFMFNASHIHVGSIHDESKGIHLENQLLKYVPAWAALAANSPFSRGRRGGFKSWRVRNLAHGATRPNTVRSPHFSQPVWGGDAGPKIYTSPTMEVRVTDCTSSRRLLAEIGTFIAGFVHHAGEKVSRAWPTRREYHDSLTNRWAAARYGMQATFRWNGRARPVAEVLDEMMHECSDSLAVLGAGRADLELTNAMIRKRVCQADFVLSLGERYPDPYILTSVYAKVLRDWDVFDEYLASAKKLDPVPVPDDEAVLEEHLGVIGEGTHFYRLRDAMFYPGPLAEEIMQRMIRRGLITKEVTVSRGTLLHRNK